MPALLVSVPDIFTAAEPRDAACAMEPRFRPMPEVSAVIESL